MGSCYSLCDVEIQRRWHNAGVSQRRMRQHPHPAVPRPLSGCLPLSIIHFYVRRNFYGILCAGGNPSLQPRPSCNTSCIQDVQLPSSVVECLRTSSMHLAQPIELKPAWTAAAAAVAPSCADGDSWGLAIQHYVFRTSVCEPGQHQSLKASCFKYRSSNSIRPKYKQVSEQASYAVALLLSRIETTSRVVTGASAQGYNFMDRGSTAVI